MPFFEKMLLASAALAVASGLDARPQLPHCECLQTWPHSDTRENWGKTYGLGTELPHSGDQLQTGPYAGQYALAVPYGTATGCIDLGVTWGYGTEPAPGEWQFCVPDVPAGGCVGLGSYAHFAQGFVMKCGSATNVTDANPVLDADQLRAADAYESKLGEMFGPGGTAQPAPKCECLTEWDAEFASTYCGPNTPTGAVDSATCTAPQGFDRGVTDTVSGSLTPLLTTPDAEWCQVPEFCTAAPGKFYDPCSGKHWMELPNTFVAGRPPSITYSFSVFDFLVTNVIEKITPGIPNFGTGVQQKFVPMTFMQENTIAAGYEADSYAPWDAAYAASAAKNAQYLPADASPSANIAALMAQANADAITAENNIIATCEANANCNELLNSQKCSALKALSLYQFSKPCVLGAAKVANDCLAACGTLTQSITTAATGSGTCTPGTYACKAGDGACPPVVLSAASGSSISATILSAVLGVSLFRMA